MIGLDQNGDYDDVLLESTWLYMSMELTTENSMDLVINVKTKMLNVILFTLVYSLLSAIPCGDRYILLSKEKNRVSTFDRLSQQIKISSLTV